MKMKDSERDIIIDIVKEAGSRDTRKPTFMNTITIGDGSKVKVGDVNINYFEVHL
jgi:hypothetical protein